MTNEKEEIGFDYGLNSCRKCGKGRTREDHDGCIGTLNAPNIMNACCGHGNDNAAYVQFWDEPRISGTKAIKYIDNSQDSKGKLRKRWLSSRVSRFRFTFPHRNMMLKERISLILSLRRERDNINNP